MHTKYVYLVVPVFPVFQDAQQLETRNIMISEVISSSQNMKITSRGHEIMSPEHILSTYSRHAQGRTTGKQHIYMQYVFCTWYMGVYV